MMSKVNSDSLRKNVAHAAVDDASDHDDRIETAGESLEDTETVGESLEDIETGEAATVSTVSKPASGNGWLPATIENGCAICLDPYGVGDAIVWSSNELCRHAFHQDCVLDYFLHLHQKESQEEEKVVASTLLSAPCPCCRQSFCQPRLVDKAYGTACWRLYE